MFFDNFLISKLTKGDNSNITSLILYWNNPTMNFLLCCLTWWKFYLHYLNNLFLMEFITHITLCYSVLKTPLYYIVYFLNITIKLLSSNFASSLNNYCDFKRFSNEICFLQEKPCNLCEQICKEMYICWGQRFLDIWSLKLFCSVPDEGYFRKMFSYQS